MSDSASAPARTRSSSIIDSRILLTEGLWRTYSSAGETIDAVRDAEIALEAGRVALIQGKSGSGKTTLLNLVGGLDVPTAGRVLYRGKDIAGFSPRERTAWHRREVGFVFQAFALLAGLTACENVDLPLRISGCEPEEATSRALAALEKVGLAKRAHHRTEELSGGEQQRVAIARGIVTEPRLLLADEPTGELDRATAARMLEILRDLARSTHAAVCLTSHDPSVAGLVDAVFLMEDGAVTPRECEG
jgi:putative ABC transport system ATP-binding protein